MKNEVQLDGEIVSMDEDLIVKQPTDRGVFVTTMTKQNQACLRGDHERDGITEIAVMDENVMDPCLIAQDFPGEEVQKIGDVYFCRHCRSLYVPRP